MRIAATFSKSTSRSFNPPAWLPFVRGGTCDRFLLFTALSLAAFGLVMVYSASYIFAQERFGNGLYFFHRHMIYLALGGGVMLFCRFLDYRVWKKLALPLFLLACGLVALTYLPGIAHRAGGASRWIRLGPLTFQPVECAKIALLMLMARQLSSGTLDRTKFTTGFLLYSWPAALLAVLCILQPDFGSTALVAVTAAILFYVAGVRLRFLLSVIGVSVPLLAMAMVVAPYRRARLLTYLDPWADPQGAGFQIIQSFLAFYRGGLFGVGLGNSRAKVFYLPEAHNDFILSVVGEELGFVGVSLLAMAFLFLIFRGVRVAAKATDSFAALLATGLIVLLGLEVFWNASIVLGILPTKGMNLPFISSGGTSIICALAAVGILLNISAQSRAGSAEA